MEQHNPRSELIAQKKAEKEEAEKKVSRLCRAYLTVLGDWEKGPLTDAQRIVKEDMEFRGYMQRTTFLPDASGHLQAERAAIAEGARQLVLQIKEFIRYGNKAKPE